MMKRTVPLIAGLGVLAVLVVALLEWRAIAVEVLIARLHDNPRLQDAYLVEPPDSLRGRAVRKFFAERPALLVQGLLDRFFPAKALAPEADRGALGIEETRDGPIAWYRWEVAGGGRAKFERNTIDEIRIKKVPSLASILDLLDGRSFKTEGRTCTVLGGKEPNGARFRRIFYSSRVEVWSPDPREDFAPFVSSIDAWAWTGKELLVVQGVTGAALDPDSGRWRTIRENPEAGRAADIPGASSLIALPGGNAFLAFLREKGDVDLQEYDPARNSWTLLRTVTRTNIRTRMTLLRAGPGVILLAGNLCAWRISGAGGRVSSAGAASPEKVLGTSCRFASVGEKLYAWDCGGKGGGSYDWDGNRWEAFPPAIRDAGPSAIFAFVAAGKELAAVGCNASRSKVDGIMVLDPRTGTWRPIPLRMDGISEPAVAWTGKGLFVWGGKLAVKNGDPPATGALVDLAAGTSRPISAAGGPEPRDRAICAWTGREVLIAGGMRVGDIDQFTDAWAFEPRTCTWRRLENYPRPRPVER